MPQGGLEAGSWLPTRLARRHDPGDRPYGQSWPGSRRPPLYASTLCAVAAVTDSIARATVSNRCWTSGEKSMSVKRAAMDESISACRDLPTHLAHTSSLSRL